MLDIAQFSINNAFFTLGNKIIQQVHGIPMGDPLSPAICIATCAHMEMRWYDNLPKEIQEQVRFTRYLDDIFMIANRKAIGDFESFITKFTNECYPACLILEETNDDEYLECKTKISSSGNEVQIAHWNKNYAHMMGGDGQYFYKHQHFDSYTTNHSKRGALIGTWTRMQDNSNSDEGLEQSVREKTFELQSLGYPDRYITNTLKYMFNKTHKDVWMCTCADKRTNSL